MNKTMPMMALAAILCAGCGSVGTNPGGPLSELEMKGGLVYLKGDSVPYTGMNKMTDPSTGRKMVLSFKNGLKHGRFEEWYNSAQRRAVAEWREGRIISGTTWKLDGTEASRVVNGTGNLILFRADGSRESEKHYRNGEQVPGASGGGDASPNASHVYPVSTVQPVKDDSGLYINPGSGQPFHGVYDYYKQGCRYRGRISNGKRDGLVRVWYTGGAPLMEADYSNGKINGRFVEWYPNGERMVDAIFQRGRLICATSWQMGGKVASDLPKGTGTLVLFYPTGEKRRESVYDQGMKVGRSN